MLLIYPAIVHQDPDGIWAEFPDLPGCQTYCQNLQDILSNAAEALEGYSLTCLELGKPLPVPSNPADIKTDANCFVTLIQSDVDLAKNTKSVKKTLSIPSWLNEKALAANVNFSGVLQEALLHKLQLA